MSQMDVWNAAITTLLKGCKESGGGTMKAVPRENDDQPIALVYAVRKEFADSPEALNELNDLIEAWEQKWGED